MNILIAAGVPRRREGGVAGIVSNYAEGLQRRGHAVTTVFSDDLMPPHQRSGRFAELTFARRLSRFIQEHRAEYSIVNLHAPAGAVYCFRRRFLRRPGPPCVVTLHGLEENRIYAMKREHKKDRAKDFSLKNRIWHRLYHQPRFDVCIRTADAVHCFSRDVWAVLRLKYNLDDDRVAFIPNGVDERFFQERQYSSSRPVRLLFAGTWLEQRGIHYLRDALPGVFSKCPELRMTFAGAGVPGTEIRSFFGPAAAAHLDILETVPWENMPQLYAEHDILVFPSLVEGQPSVVLEAMASGMPVITAETCGMADLIDHGRDGWLVPPADAHAIEDGILQLCGSAELREALGRAAQSRMARRTWNRAVEDFETLLERVFQKAQQRD